MQYRSWTWTISTAFLGFNLGLDWVLMVLMSVIFWSKMFLVFLVSLLVFGWMFSQYLETAEVFVYRYGFRVFDIFSVIIQSYIEGCFSFSNWIYTGFYWIHTGFYKVRILVSIWWNYFYRLFLDYSKCSVGLKLLKCSLFITCLQQSALLVVSSFLFFFYCVPSNQLSQVLAFVESLRTYFQIHF